ncbi:GntR family transcriptional regulator [Paenibacillus sp. J5C_2022]|uniref:GntR family transcriptional regulator n=1 Tax=Paenibacillus sp. J5C2022 TaxID=2977129 RepID=UPI0021D37B13|nr:GntR family transcriptional regulator [Paenibacillus sp. J5C2022]MCU6712347.1 GntR family transcriptional regulator [Paenibacillus sp. J5C2022]
MIKLALDGRETERSGEGVDRGKRPLYRKIYEELLQKIESGELKEDQQLPTEAMLADSYGVSIITSKRALLELERDGYIFRRRGSGSYVKKRGQQKQTEAYDIGKMVAMVLPYVDSSGLLGYIQGAADYLDSKGYYLTIHTSNWNYKKEKEFLTSLPRREIAGIILYPVSTQRNIEVLYSHYMNQYPVVTIDQYYDNVPVSSVVSDNYKGGYMICTELIKRGHSRIAFVSSIGIEYRSSVRDRFYGYCAALREADLAINTDLIITDFYDKFDQKESRTYYKAMIEQLHELGVTAIQAEHDHIAVELLWAALELGVKVPEQLSIVGFDNHEISRSVERPVTTVEQNFCQIGSMAASIILEQIEQGFSQQQRREKIDVAWIERESTGPAS